jgi:erythromycin esterase-like protein
MAQLDDSQLREAIRKAAHPLDRREPDYGPLLDLVGDARFVLLGEASHGTHEFYRARAEITKRLIEEKGFTAVAVEADWPAAYRVNRYVRGASDDESATEALGDFERFPTWMWRNSDVLDFVGWLRQHNDSLPRGDSKMGFYGIDLYSMYASMEAVLAYLDRIDPEAAKRARYRYQCFGHFGEDSQAYGYAASFGFSQPCEEEVVNQLVELRRSASDYMQMDGRVAEDEYFYAEQNARLVKNAEQYYRSMFGGRMQSWNLRDQHMAETLDALVSHFDRQGQHTKVAVWAHNSHLGDARFTEMGQRGELNVGQLVRELYGDDAVLVGFSTNTGTVTAASNWDEPPQRKRVRPALPESYEALFHSIEMPDFLLILRAAGEVAESLRKPRLERAIGVIYRPETERISHYFHAQLPGQFDAVIHFDETRAVEPLERTAGWESGEVPETYPYAV